MIIGGSGSGKINTLINLINEQYDIDKIYLYAKELSEPKYDLLIKKRKNARTNILMTQMHLASAQIVWMTLMRRLIITTQVEKEKF